jgi:hypothetical protein
VDADDGQVLVRRAVALRPEFAYALHRVLREQALRPFRGAAADRALDKLRYATGPSAQRARVVTRSAAVSGHEGRGASARVGRGGATWHRASH